MSRIGRKIINIPDGVTVNFNADILKASGVLGELSLEIPQKIKLTIENNIITVERHNNDKISKSLHGTFRQLIDNMIIGVSKGFEKTLELIGVGYRVAMEGNEINMHLGFSHPVKIEIPSDVKVKVEKNKITISGTDKQRVGQFTAEIRAFKKPEPYKGKGLRYLGEKIKLKAGKTAKTSK
ncbi:MAG: 50S ribosomal protein L6 [Patescibacteria group bacterium]|jgi:large subunit ribosomal protein L6